VLFQVCDRTAPYGRAVPLDPALESLVERQIESKDVIAAAGMAICWPNDSPFAVHTRFIVNAGESIDAAAERLDLPWAPQWLFDAGYTPWDYAGAPLNPAAEATASGPVSWTPGVRLCRLDDQVPNTTSPGSVGGRRRLAGEVALLALWSAAATRSGIAFDDRPTPDLSGNTRGATFKEFLVYFLRRRVPEGWRVEPEVALTEIRGLHMRRGVSGRRSDIVVVDDGNRLVAVVSSKWTWRSDRGTEAAQIVPIMKYRPDVPYTLVTAEFPRAKVVARESIEDRAYHLCPDWVGAWIAVNESTRARTEMPDLASLTTEGRTFAETLGLSGLDALVRDLTRSGTIL
jgi:hypothetical protein